MNDIQSVTAFKVLSVLLLTAVAVLMYIIWASVVVVRQIVHFQGRCVGDRVRLFSCNGEWVVPLAEATRERIAIDHRLLVKTQCIPENELQIKQWKIGEMVAAQVC